MKNSSLITSIRGRGKLKKTVTVSQTM